MKKNKLRLGSNPLDWLGPSDPVEPLVHTTSLPDIIMQSEPEKKCDHDASLLYYYPYWDTTEPVNEKSSEAGISDGHIYAVLDSDHSLFNWLRSRLGEERVVLVRPGGEFREIEGNIFEIDIQKPDHYLELLGNLSAGRRLPTRIIHSWAGDDGSYPTQELECCLDRGIYSLFHLTKAYINQASGNGLELLFIHSSKGGYTAPQHEAVHAFVRSLFRENPLFVYQCVELRNGHCLDYAAAILDEFARNGAIDFEVRLEQGRRMVKRLREYSPTLSTLEALPVKDGGVYLVTGGSGALGVHFSQYLVSREKTVRLALTGRRAADEKTGKAIELLRQNGGEVLYIQSDITEKKGVRTLVASVKERFGRIDGVFHCAGVTFDSLLVNKGFHQMAAVLAPKVKGTLYLYDVLKEEALDFLILCSSIAGTTGNAGQSDYAYANAFMDCFAQSTGSPCLSIGWSLWGDGGMRISRDELARLNESIGIVAMPGECGSASLEEAYRSNLPHCVAVYANSAKFKRFLERKAGRTAVSRPSRPEVITSAPPSEKLVLLTEKYLKRVISEETRIPAERIDVLESFETYGIDSIIVNQFNGRMERDFGKLSRTLLFECRTIKTLTEYFIKNFRSRLEEFFDLQVPAAPGENIAAPADEWPELKSFFLGNNSRRLPAVGHHGHFEVAIIGLGGRYPGSGSLREFWQNLIAGRDCVTEVPAERWDGQAYYDPDPEKAKEGKIYCKWGGFIDDVAMFDPIFFNISPKEAELMDPQERLFLETVWETFEDAGYSKKSLERESMGTFAAGGEVGVFVGVTSHSYQLLGPELWRKGNFTIPTSSGWSIANRISFFFNLKGPSMPVDTACSSSLVAVHLACESLRRSECRMAVAGGVNLYLHPAKYLGMCSLKMLSPSGKCYTFGNGSDGFVPGEGVGAALLKPMANAMADGDHIYAVIKGTAINHGGRTNGFTVPDPNTQADLVLQALANAGVDAESIGYVEAHGTGTILGDPIEIEGLTKAFGKSTKRVGFCPIGSVKSNIGHLESAAGLAGLTKIVLQLKNRTLVPSLHARALNPNIDFERSPFYVQRELSEWRTSELIVGGAKKSVPRRAGLSSFGAGGTNAHVVVEEYTAASGNDGVGTILFVLSAKSDKALGAYCSRFVDFLDGPAEINPADLAYTLQVGRDEMEERLAIVADGLPDLRGKMSDYLSNGSDSAEIFRGSTKQNRAITGVLNGDEEVSQLIGRWVAKKEFAKIAGLWTQGLNIDWQVFYPLGKPRRVSLPTYPFGRQRYWITGEGYEHGLLSKSTTTRAYLHPLIHENRSSFEGIRYSTNIAGIDLPAIGVESNGKIMLNCFACLEMARAAGVLAGHGPVAHIRDIVWPHQLELSGDATELHTALFADGDDVHFEITRPHPGDSDELIAYGKLFYQNGNGASLAETIDINEIKRRCSRTEIPACEGFPMVRELYLGNLEGFVHIAAHKSANGKSRDLVLHPVVMAGVRHSLSALAEIAASQPSGVFVPCNLREVDVFDAIPGDCYAYIFKSQGFLFDLLVLDLEGNVCVRLAGLRLRPEGKFSYDIEDLLVRLQAGKITVDDALSFSEVRR